MNEKVAGMVKNLASQVDGALPSTLVAHATVAGAVFGTERKVYVGSDIVLPLDIFTKPWGYVALGHLHKHQVLNENPPVVYSGSVDRVDFGEEEEDKGFIVAELNADISNFEFIPVPARKFISINVKIDENDVDPMRKIISEFQTHNFNNAVVKVIITIPESLTDFIEENKIREKLKSAYYVAGIRKEIIRTQRTLSQVENIESISPAEALEKYFLAKGKERDKIDDYKKFAEKIIRNAEET
jgi:exonuclease SbcD